MTSNQSHLRAVAPFQSRYDEILARLKEGREAWRKAHHAHVEYGAFGFPARLSVQRAITMLGTALFPLRLGPPELNPANEDAWVEATLETALSLLGAQLRLEIGYSYRDANDDRVAKEAETILARFADTLPAIRSTLDSDVEAAYRGDPAARSVDEVLLCYPCIIAVIHYRIAHVLHGLGAPLVARIIAEIAHSRTGIDIHPGAVIGSGFFIDHGTGVVIGETAIIGQNVRIYQMVTLGARSFATDESGSVAKGQPRHPVVEDNVIIYAGATILGRVTIGRGSVIGGNVWLTDDVPPYSIVQQALPLLNIKTGDADDPLLIIGG